MSKQPPEVLFKELEDAIQESDFDKVVEISDKVLAIDPNDGDALLCKVVALIQLSSFDEAIQTINKSAHSSKLIFEKSYCLYRLKSYKESLSLINSHPSPKPIRLLELEAQVYYRLDNYDAAIKLYHSLIEEHHVTSPEVKTNLVAAYISAGYAREAEKIINANKAAVKDSFDFAYNAGSAALEAGNYEAAESYLNLSQDICRKTMTEEGASTKEIEDELAIIKTQLAVLHQLQSQNDKAIQVYNSMLSGSVSDESVTAVASNNIVVIQKQHHLFDSFKKLKQATSETLEGKLNSTQKKIIGFNRCLILLYMNKGEQCRELVKLLQEQFPESDRLALVLASLLYKEKKGTQAEELLKEFADKHPNHSLRVQLSLAQLHLSRGNIPEAIKIITSIGSLKNKAAIVASLVSLNEQTNNIEGAMKIFDDYTSHLEKKDEEEYIRMLKENATFKLKYKRYREAAQSFEKVNKLRPTDLEALAGLVIANSQFDPEKAERLDAKLPKLANDSDEVEIDAEALENLAAPTIKREEAVVNKEYSNFCFKLNTPSEKKDDTKKPKKKKKNPKPKNFDPSKQPDPERWIPLKDRSYYKSKKNKKNMKSGPQGVQEKKPIQSPGAVKYQPTGGATPQVATMEVPTNTQTQSEIKVKNIKKKKGGRH